MKKFNSEFWHKLGGMIGYILVGFSFIGKEVLGIYYPYLISAGILAILICIVAFVIKEFENK